jgi:hypothetical protein
MKAEKPNTHSSRRKTRATDFGVGRIDGLHENVMDGNYDNCVSYCTKAGDLVKPSGVERLFDNT